MPTAARADAFVWVWLPGRTQPVVAGRLDRTGDIWAFTYGASYLGNPCAIELYDLPLSSQPIPPRAGVMAGCLADAGPDAWGQRVIRARLAATGATTDPDLMTYLLAASSDRVGALDFQTTPTQYTPRGTAPATLADLAAATAAVEEGNIHEALQPAMLHGTTAGGARPKATLVDKDRQLLAKFSSPTDTMPIVQAEYVAMRLASFADLDVPAVSLTTAAGRDVLLVERFDRPLDGGRRLMVSAMTLLGLDEHAAIWAASYADLAHLIRHRFTAPASTLHELFARITFNILVSNTDDHARNHAAFWDGTALTLTPAYDVCPQPRSGGEAQQAIAIGEDGWRMSQVAGCVDRAALYGLTSSQARDVIDHQIAVINDHFQAVCDEASMPQPARGQLWGRQFLNPYALYEY